jgi:uncharacterized repeat protein (TIGR01451 family)
MAMLTPPLPGSVDLAVCVTTDRVWGVVGAGETATVTVDGTQMGAAQADNNGFFWTTLYDADGQRPGLDGGDVVVIYHNGAQAANVTLRSISGQADVVNDRVSGDITGAGHPISVTVYAPWGEPSTLSYSQTVSTDGSGHFDADLSGIWDFTGYSEPVVAYVEGGVEMHRHVYPSASLIVRPSPSNAVRGYAAPGTTVTAAVSLLDVLKESTILTADPATGWYSWDVPTDILQSDVVMVELAGGAVLSRTVDALSVSVDAANDRATGVALPGAVVRGQASNLTPQGWRDVQTSTGAHPGTGAYTLEFGTVADIMPGSWVGVFVADTQGDDLNLWAPSQSVEVHQTWNDVRGNGSASPGPQNESQTVTLTLYSAASGSTSSYSKQMDWWGSYWFDENDGLPDIAAGDAVTVASDSWEGVVQVTTMTAQHDLDADQISGTVLTPTSRVELSGRDWEGAFFPVGGQFEMLVTATGGAWIAAPAGFDLNNHLRYDVGHRTEGHYLQFIAREPDWIGVEFNGNAVVGAVTPPGTAYTITLLDPAGSHKAQLTGVSQDPIGRLGWRDFGGEGVRIALGDKVQVQSAAGFSQTLVVPHFDVWGNADTDVAHGEAPPDVLLYVSVDDEGEGFVPVDADGQFSVTVGQLQDAWGDGDLEYGNHGGAQYFDQNRNWVWCGFTWPSVRVNYAHDWVQGDYAAGHTLWITVTDSISVPKAAAVVSSTHGGGWGGPGFQTQGDDWSPSQPDIEPGDWVLVRADDGYYNVMQVGTITGTVDADNDSVTGRIYATWFTQTLDVEAHVWECCGAPNKSSTAAPDGSVPYLCQWDPGTEWDVLQGHQIAVMYIEPDGDRVFNVFEDPRLDLMMRVNYGHDWVEGNYWAGHTLWITVTESFTPNVKATAELTTGVIPWWGGGQTGFSTNLGDPWVPGRPDIQPDDRVFGTLDNGYSSTVRIGTITAELDVDADTISGTIDANWFTDTLNAHCRVWEPDGPGTDFTVDPDGGSYFCDFGAMGWDLLPGHDVGVEYIEPDEDYVINVFREPAPDVRVDKWVEGNNEAAPGGTAVFTIRYRNDGSAVASAIWLTDTLPANTAYITDSSGVAANVGAEWVGWTLGPLDPGEERQFYVVLSNTANASDTLRNEVDVFTADDDNSGNNHAEVEVHVTDAQPDLYVNKWHYPGDPAAGQTFLYEIDYGNQGPVASGPVLLTDTLPLSTTIVSWFSEYGYDLWTEAVSSSSQLVLSAPAIPGHWSDRIYLRLRVDGGVLEGTQLTNTVEIHTADDSDPGNDQHMHDDTWVGQPRWNGSVGKRLNWGRLAPGGEVHYWIRFQNEGNMPAHVWLTDTLPSGTSFDSAWIRPPCCPDFPPDHVDGDIVAWDLGVLEPGESYGLDLYLNISSTVAPGTIITNCVEITMDGVDENPGDDVACMSVAVGDTGRNLRLEKRYWWEGDSRLGYEIQVWNVGTEDLLDVQITDTYPLSTTWNGDWGWDRWWGPELSVTHSAPHRQLVFSTDEIECNERVQIKFSVDLDPDIVGRPGMVFTNTVEAPIVGDVDPDDNHDQVVADTGPVVGYTNVDLVRNYNGESNVGNLVTDGMLWMADQLDDGELNGSVEIGFTNPGGLRADILIPEGAPLPYPITPQDTLNLMPFGNTLLLMDLTGAQIQELLDQAATLFKGILQSAGISWYWYNNCQCSSPTSWGAYNAMVNGEPLNPSRTYRVVTNNWLAAGGDGWVTFADGTNRWDTGYLMQEGVNDYIRWYNSNVGPIDYEVEGRITNAWMRVNYAHDWVGGNYPAGHTLWITVTDSISLVKAVAVVSSTSGDGWGGAGFETQGDDWSPSQPDMEPGDWVLVRADDGYYNVMQVGTITGTVDADNDSVTGRIYATWFTQTLDVEAHVWECCGAPGKSSTAAPDGSVPYLCQWDPGTEWDVLRGHRIAVMYIEPDGDRVINVFRQLAPDMRVEKWVEGHDQAAPGGSVVFTIRYRNDGEVAAGTILLTDTLPANTAYITDSSGGAANVGAGWVSWTLGPLDPGEDRQFHIVLSNTLSASETLRNEVDVFTADDDNSGNDHAEAEVHVADGQPDVHVNKGGSPGDPAAGQTFLYWIDYGNNGPVASGPVWLTDTLPLSTTIVSWFSDKGYDLWTEAVSSSSQLVLSAAAIPGYWSDRIYLRLRVDGGVLEGTQLTNMVEIDTAGDSDLGNNQDTHDDTWVGQLRWNGSVSKSLDQGRLVPGGDVQYTIDFQNEGNMPAHVWLTDTLPSGASFDSAWTWPPCCPDFPPDHVGADMAAWDLGVLEPAESYGLGLRLNISSTVVPVAILTNCVEITMDGVDENPGDDVACKSVAVGDTGRNLRLEKHYWWEGDSRLRYEIQAWNAGTEDLLDLQITDTYPLSTTWNGDWGWDRWWGPEISVTHNAPQRQLIFSTDEIECNERVQINFRVDLDPDVVGEPRMAFTNTVEAPIAGDVYPDDNFAQVVAYSDPCMARWKPMGGPLSEGGRIPALAVHPTISGTVYAAARSPSSEWRLPSMIYKSTDGGAHWTALYGAPNRVMGLATADNLVYAGSYNRDDSNPHPVIHRSLDGGQSWTARLSLAEATIWAFAIHPTVTQTAIAGGGDYPDKAMLYQTTDAGLTWTETFSYTNPGWYPTVNTVLIHPTTPLTWLLTHDGEVNGAVGSYIYRSTDGGLTWTEVYSMTDDIFASLVAHPLTPTILYAGTWQNNFHQSTDGGATWAAVITDGSAGQTVVLDPFNTLYANNGSNVRKSTDEGGSWNTAADLPGEVLSLAIDLGPTPGALYAGLSERGVHRSINGGSDWQARNNGIQTLVLPRDIDVDPQNLDKLLVASEGSGGWMTTDAGATWTQLPLADWLGAFAINPEDPNIVYAGEQNCGRGAVQRSEDGGLSFETVYTATFIISDCSGGSEDLHALAIAPSVSSTVYAAGADRPNWEDAYAVIVRSPDDGVSCTEVFTLPARSRVQALAIDPSDHDIVFAGGEDCSGTSGPDCVGFVYRTTDGGANWTLVLSSTSTVRSVVVDWYDPYVLYVADDNYDVYTSTDRGDNWDMVRTCCPSGNLVVMDPNVPYHLYLGGWGYVAETLDAGQRWDDARINRGTPRMDPRALAVDNGTLIQTLYAGFDGVWYYERVAMAGMPRDPWPPDAATGMSIWTNLDWSDTTNTTEYDVYFGTSPQPPHVGTVTSSDYELPKLSYSTQYWWQVVSKNDCGETWGHVWTFTTGVNQRPRLGTVDPSSGSGSTGVTSYFTTTWTDADGWEDLKQCYFHIGESPILAGNVTLMYNAAKNKLWMLADDGASWLGGYAPGSANSIENSQAIVYCNLTTVEGAGNTLRVTWAIEFKPGYTGAKKTGLKCKDRSKARAKAKWKGTWTIY